MRILCPSCHHLTRPKTRRSVSQLGYRTLRLILSTKLGPLNAQTSPQYPRAFQPFPVCQRSSWKFISCRVSPQSSHQSLSRLNYQTSTFSTVFNPASMQTPLKARVEDGHGVMDNQSIREVEVLADHLEAPSLDDRSYRVIRLSNKLEALLVHDPETDQASAAMDVNVGNYSDPEDMPGMAHAVEHLLFMGTEKYPVENAYSQYLTAHNGHSNAYTAATSTNYYFEVSARPMNGEPNGTEAPQEATEKPDASALEGALDRFSQFFIAPLFLASTLDRELKAVDSENKKNLQSDSWRFNQLSKSLSNPAHPYCHFSTGSLTTLRDDPKKRGIEVREEFMKFHAKHYSANRMKLVVLGRESLDELEGWVTEYFSAVRNKDLPRNRWDDVQPLTEKELGMQYFAKPVMESRALEITFPYPDEESLYEAQPSRYLSHLIGHEGPGSILSYIKAKGWANTLEAGCSQLCPGSAMFYVEIRLTEEGLKIYPEIVKVIFQYIALMRETPPQEWIVQEMIGISEVDFRFMQKSPASSFTSRVSSVMQKEYPREWLLSTPVLIRKFDGKAIGRAMENLRADNFRLSVASQEFPGDWDQKEKWYGTEYKYEKIPPTVLQEYEQAAKTTSKNRIPELFLPGPNEFIPKRLDVVKREVKDPTKAPTMIRNDPGVRVWFKKDDRFWIPKANVFVTLRNPLVFVTPSNSVKTEFYCSLLRDALTEYSYDAELAGLEYDLDDHSSGIDVELSGYNDKMPVLLEKVVTTMRDLEVKPERFDIIKDRLLRGLRNWDFQQPYHQVGHFTSWLNNHYSWLEEEYLAELPLLTVKDMQEFIPLMLGQIHIEALYHGNLYKEDALTMTSLIESILKPRPLPQSQWRPRRSMLYPEGSNFTWARTLKDPKNVNNALEYLLAVGPYKDKDLRARLSLFAQMTNEPAFNQLRTKEQLGYVVFTGVRASATTLGYRVILQSERSAEYLEGRIDAFLAGFETTLAEMSPDEFEGHKRSLINKRQEKPKNLSQESSQFWANIGNEYYDFTYADTEVSILSPISKKDLQDFYKHFIKPSSSHRSKVAIHLIAQSAPSEIASSMTPEEQSQKVMTLLAQYLNSAGIAVDHEQLGKRMANADIASGDQDTLIEAVHTYLVEDAGIEASKAGAVIAEGQKLMATTLPSLGISTNPKSLSGEDQDAPTLTSAQPMTPVTFIKDPHKFKAGLRVSAGALPVKDLSEFAETESKL